MARILNRLRAALYCIAFVGIVVALCRSFGIDAKTVGYWVLMGWLVMAAMVLVMAMIVPVWEKAGQPRQPRQRRRSAMARTVTGTQVPADAES